MQPKFLETASARSTSTEVSRFHVGGNCLYLLSSLVRDSEQNLCCANLLRTHDKHGSPDDSCHSQREKVTFENPKRDLTPGHPNELLGFGLYEGHFVAEPLGHAPYNSFIFFNFYNLCSEGYFQHYQREVKLVPEKLHL